MNDIAAAAATSSYGAWAYLLVFALVALGFAGIPGVGAAVIGGAAVLASQGKLTSSGYSSPPPSQAGPQSSPAEGVIGPG